LIPKIAEPEKIYIRSGRGFPIRHTASAITVPDDNNRNYSAILATLQITSYALVVRQNYNMLLSMGGHIEIMEN
jgi:hypothetical protein